MNLYKDLPSFKRPFHSQTYNVDDDDDHYNILNVLLGVKVNSPVIRFCTLPPRKRI